MSVLVSSTELVDASFSLESCATIRTYTYLPTSYGVATCFSALLLVVQQFLFEFRRFRER